MDKLVPNNVLAILRLLTNLELPVREQVDWMGEKCNTEQLQLLDLVTHTWETNKYYAVKGWWRRKEAALCYKEL